MDRYREHSAGHLDGATVAVEPTRSWAASAPVECSLVVGGERFGTRVESHDATHVDPLRDLATDALTAASDGAWTYAMAPSTRGIYLVYCVRRGDATRVVDRLGFG